MEKLNDIHCFFRKENPLSNWHPCSFEMGNPPVRFNCAEQAMMYAKAKLFGDNDIAQKILQKIDPAEHKRLGRQVRNFDENKWRESRLSIMCSILEAKFFQNEDLAAVLHATQGKTLIEASPYDKVWGAGLDASHRDIAYPQKWPGLNLLGKCLERTRSKLQERLEQRLSQGSGGLQYAIARTLEEGLERSFIEGPFEQFPHAEHAAGALVFVTNTVTSVPVNAPITPAPTMDDLVGHSFDERMREFIGRYDIFSSCAHAPGEISSKQQLASLIETMDELLFEHAHEMRYQPDYHEQVANEVGGWKRLRHMIWTQFAPDLPLEAPMVAPDVAPPPVEHPSPPVAQTGRFNFQRPKG